MHGQRKEFGYLKTSDQNLRIGLFLLCAIAAIVFWLRGNTEPDITEGVRVRFLARIADAIEFKYPIDNNGKLPPADWERLRHYLPKEDVPEWFLAQTVYNDVNAGKGFATVNSPSTPLLFHIDPGTKHHLVMFCDGAIKPLTPATLSEVQASMTETARKRVDRLIANSEAVR